MGKGEVVVVGVGGGGGIEGEVVGEVGRGVGKEGGDK